MFVLYFDDDDDDDSDKCISVLNSCFKVSEWNLLPCLYGGGFLIKGQGILDQGAQAFIQRYKCTITVSQYNMKLNRI